MSRARATLESVALAKALLEQRGEPVTVKAVRLLLNGGSHTTINRHLRTLRGVQLVPANIAKHLLSESRRQRATIAEMREDGEPVVIEDDCNVTVEAERTIRSGRGSDFFATVCERWTDIVGKTNAPVRLAYVLKVVTHSPWHATAVMFEEGHRHG